jgi:two-component system chemotaxis sensor kinase CheA
MPPMDDLVTEFIAETREMLEALERGLVAWERDPDDREQLDEIFRFVHTVKGNCGFFDLPRLEALAHAAEDALGDVRAGKRVTDSRLVDAVLAVIDRIGEMVETVATGDDISGGDDSALIAMLGEIDQELRGVEGVPSAASDQPAAKAPRRVEAQRSVRLPTSLVDRVMSGVSDMILVRNELERQLRHADGDSAMIANFGRLSSLLSEMQAAMARVRMQPIQTLFGSYERMIRDLSAELGKQIEVEVESGQVELDREMIELLRDPLLHVIRNAIDHGIETPDDRRACGKRPEGRLLLSARQTGNEIRIAILDDGRGIDADRVVAQAIERGNVTAEQAERMDPGQRLMLICEPGLSTAGEVTSISGRGVGMDAVRASIERIGGKLRILSAPGDGTRFMFDVPLTLSIVPSITVEVGDQVFAVPRSYVREIVRNGSEIEVERIGGMRHVKVRGELYPCLGLGEVFGIEGEDSPNRQTLVMVTMIDGSVFALCVDGIADHCDLVIRPSAPQVIATGLYVGVAQLNDGKPALMLDLVGISQLGGINSDVHSRAVARAEVQAEDDAGQLVQMIVFSSLDGIQRATPMTGVDRLIEVAITEIGLGGGRPHIVFGDEILPLHGFEPGEHGETIDVLVLAADSARLAYATAGSIDTSDIDLASATSETGRRLALLEGQTVELLDLAMLAGTAGGSRPTCRLPAGDRWSREVLRPLVENAGYRVAGNAEQHVDLEILLEGEKTMSPDNAAGETLLIGNQEKGRKPSVQTVDRDDRAALTAAVNAAAKRRAR